MPEQMKNLPFVKPTSKSFPVNYLTLLMEKLGMQVLDLKYADSDLTGALLEEYKAAT